MAGRVCVYVPDHPKANNRGYILRSRHVVEKRLGRRLREDEEVHHKNGDTSDDRDENLEVLSTADHARRHYYERSASGKPFGSGARLDYDLVESLMAQGLGYKRIAARVGAPTETVKSACRVIRRRQHSGGELGSTDV